MGHSVYHKFVLSFSGYGEEGSGLEKPKTRKVSKWKVYKHSFRFINMTKGKDKKPRTLSTQEEEVREI